MRQRENLVAGIAICIQHIQKALTEMNLQLTNVLTDISGKSGMAFLRAIVAGERDPYKLAELCDSRVHATRQQVAQSLEGNWRTELLFVVQQNLYLYDIYSEQVAACDRKIEAHLQTIDRKLHATLAPLAPPLRRSRLGKPNNFRPNGTLGNGQIEDLTRQVTWGSSNSNIVTISSTGLATGIAGGIVTVSASFQGETVITSLSVGTQTIAPAR
jgi:transposase